MAHLVRLLSLLYITHTPEDTCTPFEEKSLSILRHLITEYLSLYFSLNTLAVNNLPIFAVFGLYTSGFLRFKLSCDV